MSRAPFTPTIAALPKLVPFIGPEAMERTRRRPFRARLGANESVFGPSPQALAAMRKAVNENWKYSIPKTTSSCRIAAHHGVPIECVVVGEGIDGHLGLTCMLYLCRETASSRPMVPIRRLIFTCSRMAESYRYR